MMPESEPGRRLALPWISGFTVARPLYASAGFGGRQSQCYLNSRCNDWGKRWRKRVQIIAALRNLLDGPPELKEGNLAG